MDCSRRIHERAPSKISIARIAHVAVGRLQGCTHASANASPLSSEFDYGGKLCLLLYSRGDQNVLENEAAGDRAKLQLHLHVDGFSLFKISVNTFWPILGLIIKPNSCMFIIGLFNETGRPNTVHKFIHDTIGESQSLTFRGIGL